MTLDDPFYSLLIAKNLAHSGTLQINQIPTNGFQPLWVFLRAAIEVLFPAASKDSFVVTTFALQLSLLVAAGALMSRWYREFTGDSDRAAGLLCAALFISLPGTYLAFVNPLETLLYLDLVLLSLLVYSRSRDNVRTLWPACLWGIVCGAAFLARNDFLLIFCVCAVDFMAQRPSRQRVAWIAVATVALLAIGGPWLVHNKTVYGDFMPISGRASTFITHDGQPPYLVWSAEKLWSILSGVLGNAQVFGVYNIQGGLWPGVGGLVLTIAAFRRPGLRLRGVALSTGITFLAVYWLAIGSKYDTSRYLFPLVAFSIPAVTAFLCRERRPLEVLPSLRLAGVVLLCAALSLMNSWAKHVSWQPFTTLVALARELESSDEFRHKRIGAFNSGALSWFHENTVNLDGKVDARAYRALTSGTFAQHVDSLELDYFADNINYLAIWYQGSATWRSIPARSGNFVILRRETRRED